MQKLHTSTCDSNSKTITSTVGELSKFFILLQKFQNLDNGRHVTHSLISELQNKISKIVSKVDIGNVPKISKINSFSDDVSLPSVSEVCFQLDKQIENCNKAVREELANNLDIDNVIALFSTKRLLSECRDLLSIFRLCNLEHSRYNIA